MFYCTNKTPNEFYHYTLKSNVNSIIEKMLLKSGEDGYLWGCLSLEDIIKHKKHQLQPETEKVLQALQPVMSLPDNGYNITKLSDMRFFDFEANGKSYGG